MSDENIENPNSPNTEGNGSEPDKNEPSDYKPLEKIENESDEDYIVRVQEANKELFARTKGAERELKEIKQKPPAELPKPPKTEPAPKPSKQEDNDRLDRIELRQMGVSSEDIQNEARDYAKLKGIPLHKAVESPYVKSLLEAERVKREEAEQQGREEAASAGGASAGTTSSKKISDDPNTWGKDTDLSTPEGVKTYEARLSAKGIDLKKA